MLGPISGASPSAGHFASSDEVSPRGPPRDCSIRCWLMPYRDWLAGPIRTVGRAAILGRSSGAQRRIRRRSPDRANRDAAATLLLRSGAGHRKGNGIGSWPGNTADSALIRQAKADLQEWNLGRVVWVGDRGFTSAAHRADLRRGGHAYILGEKLRSGSADAAAALARPGRYATVAGNLQVKEVKIADKERLIVCFNPDQATRDAA